MNKEIKRILKNALMLRKKNDYIESNNLLKKLVTLEDTGNINYQLAWSYDLIDKEKEAVFHYLRAIDLGLSKNDQVHAYIGLGSSYRILGQYQAAKKHLNKLYLFFHQA